MRSEMLRADRSQDELAIRAVESAYDAAWRAGDIRALAACFAAGAVVVNPLGETAQGRAEIENMLRAFLTGPGRGSRHITEIIRLSFITDEVAIVDGQVLLDEMEGNDTFTESSLHHRFIDILIKQNGSWVIAHVRAWLLTAQE